MTDAVAYNLVGGEVTMTDAACGKCGQRRVARIEILRLTEDGVSHAGHTIACIDCDTRPA